MTTKATAQAIDLSKLTIPELEAHLKAMKAGAALAKATESNVNMNLEANGKVLVIRIDLTKELGISKSAKSTLVGSTHGNIPVTDGIYASINVFKPLKK